MILTNPRFRLLSDLGCELAGELGFALRNKPLVIVGSDVAFAAQGIELRDQLSIRVDRKLECLNGSVVFIPATGRNSISAGSQSSRRQARIAS